MHDARVLHGLSAGDPEILSVLVEVLADLPRGSEYASRLACVRLPWSRL